MRSARGLTLVELMIAILILSIVVARGLPSVIEYIRNDRIRAAAEEMRSGLQAARTEAIRRNTTVNFVPNATGWSVVVPGAGGDPDETLITRLPKSNEAAVSVVATDALVSFNGSGRVSAPGAFSVDLAPAAGTCVAGGGDARCLRIVVAAGGMIRMCDPAHPATAPQGCQ